MKFTSFQNRAQLSTPASQVSGLHYSNPGAIAEAKAEGELYTTMAKGLTTIADKVTSAKALEANNYYNQRMGEETANLMNSHREGNALNITALYDEKQKSVMDETQKKFGSYIRFGPAAQAFQEYTMRDNATRRNNMLKYQDGESEKFAETQYQNSLTVCHNNAMEGGYSDDAINGQLARIGAITATRYAAYGKERVDAEVRKQQAGLLQGAFESALQAGQSSRLIELDNKYGAYVTPALRNQMRNAAQKGLKMEQDLKDYVKVPAGITTPEGIAQWRANMRAGKQAVTTNDGKTHYVDVAQLELPVQAGIQEQIDALRPELKGALPTIGGILNQLGAADGAEISSAARSYEHQMEVNPDAPNSWHVDRNAVDIVLPDDITGDKAEAVRRFFDESGTFDEVLFHDVGSGYHLHLGGYNGGLEGGRVAEGKSAPPAENSPITLEDRKWAEDYMKWRGNQFALHNQAINRLLDDADTQIQQLLLSNEIISEEQAMAIITPMLTGDTKTDIKLQMLAKSYVDKGIRAMAGGGRSGTGSGGGARSGGTGSRNIRPDFDEIMKQALTDYPKYGAMRAAIYEMYDNGELNDKELEHSLKLARDKKDHKGIFAINNMSAITASVKKALPGYDPVDIQNAIDCAVGQNDNYMREHNGEQMTPQAIVDIAIGAATGSAGIFQRKRDDYDENSLFDQWSKNPYETEEFTEAQLYGRGISSFEQLSDGRYQISTVDGASYNIPADKLRRVLDGETTLEEALYG